MTLIIMILDFSYNENLSLKVLKLSLCYHIQCFSYTYKHMHTFKYVCMHKIMAVVPSCAFKKSTSFKGQNSFH